MSEVGSVTKRKWEVRVSSLARNTNNKIRNIVENLQINPNPNKQLIALSIGDPTTFGNLNPSEEAIAAIQKSLEEPSSLGYAPAVGHYEARKAVAEYSSHQGPLTPEDVVLSSGCSHAIELAITVLADAGQNILLPRPGFMIYETLALGLGIKSKLYDLLPHKQWKVDLEDLERQIDDKTAAIVVINPSNPCGSVYSKEHLKEILAIASKNCVPIIADEIYEHLVFSGHEYHAISSLSVDVPVLTCSGLTKRFLAPGWRMGWVIMHDRNDVFGPQVRKGLQNLATRILGPNTLVQRALPDILRNTQETFFSAVIKFVEENAILAYDILRRVPGLKPIMPEGAMYMMIELQMDIFPSFKSDVQFVEYLVAEQSVFCLPGECFHLPNFMRIVLTVPKQVLQEACQRIEQFCQEHVEFSADRVNNIDIMCNYDNALTVID